MDGKNVYVPTRIEDPTFFSDVGERYDLNNVDLSLSEEAKATFEEMKKVGINFQFAKSEYVKKCVIIGAAIGLVICVLTFNPMALIMGGAAGFFFSMNKVKNGGMPQEGEFSNFNERFVDLCIEPVLQRIEPGVDVSFKLIYYPVYGYIQTEKDTYSSGLRSFGRWLVNTGVLPEYNDRFLLGSSVNTLNANREGFFLTNVQTWSEKECNDKKYSVLEFEGPVLTVRLKHGIKGWFTCHTTKANSKHKSTNYRKFRENKVELENDTFNNLFSAAALNDMDAFYILSPSVMERLMFIRNVWDTFGLYIVGDFCIFAIYNKVEYFEPPRSLKEAEGVSIDKYWKDFTYLIQLVYSFKDAVDSNFK